MYHHNNSLWRRNNIIKLGCTTPSSVIYTLSFAGSITEPFPLIYTRDNGFATSVNHVYIASRYSFITLTNNSWLCFYQTRSACSMDQGSNKNHSPINNFTPTVTKCCVMWEGQALPQDTKFRNCRAKIVDSRAFPSWSLIRGSGWSGLIKAEPGWPYVLDKPTNRNPTVEQCGDAWTIASASHSCFRNEQTLDDHVILPTDRIYRKSSSIRHNKSQNLKYLLSSLEVVFAPFHWIQVWSREWRCTWTSTDKRCSNYIWVISNFIT